jgi:hypothetical protein
MCAGDHESRCDEKTRAGTPCRTDLYAAQAGREPGRLARRLVSQQSAWGYAAASLHSSEIFTFAFPDPLQISAVNWPDSITISTPNSTDALRGLIVDRLFGAAPGFDAVELSLQVAVFLFYRRPGALHQRSFKPSTALAQAIGSTLAGTRQPDSREATVRDDKGGVRKRGLWTRLNGHVPRKRRNSQALAYSCARRISIPTGPTRHGGGLSSIDHGTTAQPGQSRPIDQDQGWRRNGVYRRLALPQRAGPGLAPLVPRDLWNKVLFSPRHFPFPSKPPTLAAWPWKRPTRATS